MTNQEIVEFVQDLCKKNNCKLLYLTIFGSNLYGTNISDKSDIDIKGIFLPDIKSCIFGKAPNNIHYSTGDNNSKNTVDDIDIDLWSIQYWTQRLLPISDTGAIDTLFSYTNKNTILYINPVIEPIFQNPLSFVDTTNTKTCVNYSLGQAKKYGIKGSRLGIIRTVLLIADKKPETDRLDDHFQEIIDACNNSEYCTIATFSRSHGLSDEKLLFLCGKYHNLNIKMKEFANRVRKEYESYGNRAELAEKNGGIDWKALSHAVRAIFQTQELLETGNIVFPLKRKDEIVKIKTGQYDWNTTEGIILSELSTLETIFQKSNFKSKQDRKLVEQIILNCYGVS